MTTEQHAETVALLAALMTQGETMHAELVELSEQVADLTELCGTMEVLIHNVNMRFDEL